MFDSLGDRLQNVISKFKGYGKITEDNISEMTREIRLALLEADVNNEVAKESLKRLNTNWVADGKIEDEFVDDITEEVEDSDEGLLF